MTRGISDLRQGRASGDQTVDIRRPRIADEGNSRDNIRADPANWRCGTTSPTQTDDPGGGDASDVTRVAAATMAMRSGPVANRVAGPPLGAKCIIRQRKATARGAKLHGDRRTAGAGPRPVSRTGAVARTSSRRSVVGVGKVFHGRRSAETAIRHEACQYSTRIGSRRNAPTRRSHRRPRRRSAAGKATAWIAKTLSEK